MSELIYLDSDIVVVAKRSGEPVRTRRRDQTTVVDEWRSRIDEPHLQAVHRIDQPTSGLVVMGRNRLVVAALHESFRVSRIDRVYVAVVDRAPHPVDGTFRDGITVDEKRNRSHIDPNGKSSSLRYRTIGRTEHHTVLLIRLDTGRHHQIRVQLASRGYHVVGDARYGARRPRRDRSIALHAWFLAFPHPKYRQRITCYAPFPNDTLWNAVSLLACARYPDLSDSWFTDPFTDPSSAPTT